MRGAERSRAERERRRCCGIARQPRGLRQAARPGRAPGQGNTERGTHRGNLPVGLREDKHPNLAWERRRRRGMMAASAQERRWREEKQLGKAQVNKPLPSSRALPPTRGSKG